MLGTRVRMSATSMCAFVWGRRDRAGSHLWRRRASGDVQMSIVFRMCGARREGHPFNNALCMPHCLASYACCESWSPSVRDHCSLVLRSHSVCARTGVWLAGAVTAERWVSSDAPLDAGRARFLNGRDSVYPSLMLRRHCWVRCKESFKRLGGLHCRWPWRNPKWVIKGPLWFI